VTTPPAPSALAAETGALAVTAAATDSNCHCANKAKSLSAGAYHFFLAGSHLALKLSPRLSGHKVRSNTFLILSSGKSSQVKMIARMVPL